MQITELKKSEMAQIYGGTINSTIINAIVRIASFFFDLGKETGSAIRRFENGSYCNTN